MTDLLDQADKKTILETLSWIKVAQYRDDPSKSWEERFRELEKHHVAETEFLIKKIRAIVAPSNESQ
jgi:hypothetical protein